MSNEIDLIKEHQEGTMKLRTLVSWCLMLCVPVSVWAQSVVLPEEQTTKVKRAVQEGGTGEHSRVKVVLRDKTEVKGYVSQIGPDSFQLTDNKTGKVTAIAYQDVEKVRTSGLSTGAKIAIAAGVGVGVAFAAMLGSLAASGE